MADPSEIPPINSAEFIQASPAQRTQWLREATAKADADLREKTAEIDSRIRENIAAGREEGNERLQKYLEESRAKAAENSAQLKELMRNSGPANDADQKRAPGIGGGEPAGLQGPTNSPSGNYIGGDTTDVSRSNADRTGDSSVLDTTGAAQSRIEQEREQALAQQQQSRLQELIDAGLIRVKDAGSELRASVDQDVSLFNRAMAIKSDASDVASAAGRVSTGDEPSLSDRMKAVAASATDQAKLNNSVLSQLSPAAGALVNGDSDAADRVQANLDRSTGNFADRANDRTSKVSAAYDLLNSAQRLQASTNEARQPIAPIADNAARADAYKKAAKSVWDTAKDLRPADAQADIPKAPVMTDFGPKNANGAGPLKDRSSTYFQGGTYTSNRQPTPLTLYRVQAVVGLRPVNYWSRVPPTSTPSASATLKVEVPAGHEFYEGKAQTATGEPLIYLDDLDAAWVKH